MAKTTQSKNVNKKTLTDQLAARAKIPKTRAAQYINIITNIISEALMEGKKVTISDFGTFNLSERDAFEGYDPKNKIRIQVPRRIIPVFRAGKQLKTSLNIPSIRKCTLTSPHQLELHFSKLMDPDHSQLLDPSSYNVIQINGKVCNITKVIVGTQKTITRSNDETLQGVEKVLLNVQQNLLNLEYIVKLQAPLSDIDGNLVSVPTLWSNSSLY